MALPAGVDAVIIRVFKPLLSVHPGRVLAETDVMPGAVDATTVEPAGSALASIRMNALKRTVPDVSAKTRLLSYETFTRESEHAAVRRT